ncbi:PilZ domain-containing protein [Hoeflea sp.]|uniref:PilZ domain-containing protein n=1 Tax=Hoeflea sp. TaxID=1940281 RepID=UPI0019B439BC|nr:PilZ domain-containing protein [Hoeflea sp.]MBC7281288.1 PilZ domain-containing protein [Hoeflea sp.]
MEAANAAKANEAREAYDRNSGVRYSANCPGIVELTFVNKKLYIALTGAIVNISVTGCLLSNQTTPWSTIDLGKAGDSAFDLIDEDCHIYIPWANIHRQGKVRRVGAYIIGVQFARPITEDLARRIASLEPSSVLHFKPRNARRYNRILPLGHK